MNSFYLYRVEFPRLTILLLSNSYAPGPSTNGWCEYDDDFQFTIPVKYINSFF